MQASNLNKAVKAMPVMPVRICMLCMICMLQAAMAQAQSGQKDSKMLYLNTMLGVQLPGVNALNSVLREQGYLPIDAVYFARGGGFYTIFPKIPVASLFNLSSYTATNREGSRTNWVRSTQAGTALGIVVSNSRKFQLIPYGGLVYSWYGLRVSCQEPVANTFTGYLSGPANQLHAATNGFMANFGLHLARKNIGTSRLGESLVLGLRAGYYVPVGNREWKTQATALQEGPEINPGGFYMSLLIGFAQ